MPRHTPAWVERGRKKRRRSASLGCRPGGLFSCGGTSPHPHTARPQAQSLTPTLGTCTPCHAVSRLAPLRLRFTKNHSPSSSGHGPPRRPSRGCHRTAIAHITSPLSTGPGKTPPSLRPPFLNFSGLPRTTPQPEYPRTHIQTTPLLEIEERNNPKKSKDRENNNTTRACVVSPKKDNTVAPDMCRPRRHFLRLCW